MFVIDLIFHWADTLGGRMAATPDHLEEMVHSMLAELIGPTTLQPFCVRGCSVAIIAECQIREAEVAALDLNALAAEITAATSIMFHQQFGEVLIDLAMVTYCVLEH